MGTTEGAKEGAAEEGGDSRMLRIRRSWMTQRERGAHMRESFSHERSPLE